MTSQEHPGVGPGGLADRSADRLASALEEVGFDVGRTFPTLRGSVDPRDRPVVELGTVAATVADELSEVLTGAARHGVSVPGPVE